MKKLTKAQKRLLAGLVRAKGWKGVNPRYHRTAKTLYRKGLIDLLEYENTATGTKHIKAKY